MVGNIDVSGLTTIPEKQCMVQLEKELSARPYVRRLLIIKKNGELRELPQK